MTEMKPSSFSYAGLLLKWQVFGFALVALARAVLRAERSHGRGAWDAAQHLEVTARASAHQIGEALREAYAAHPPTHEADINALEHLAIIRTLHLVLALYAKYLMQRLAGRGAGDIPGTDFIFECSKGMDEQVSNLPSYLDSS